MRLSIPREPIARDRGPSVALVGGVYVGAELAFRAIDLVFPSAQLATGVLSILLLVALTVVIAHWRDDDLLEAGVLFALLMGLAALLTRVLHEFWLTPSIWTLVTAVPLVGFALLLRTVVGGIVAGVVIWLLRRVRLAIVARSA